MSVTEKVMVMNVYKHTFHTWPQNEYWSLCNCANKTAEILGISKKTVQRIVMENQAGEEFKSPEKSGPKTDILNKLDEFTFSAIRRKVHEFFYRNESPTIKKVSILYQNY